MPPTKPASEYKLTVWVGSTENLDWISEDIGSTSLIKDEYLRDTCPFSASQSSILDRSLLDLLECFQYGVC